MPRRVDDAHASPAQLSQDLITVDDRDRASSRILRFGRQPEKHVSINFGFDRAS
jgi:hypothetical protein